MKNILLITIDCLRKDHVTPKLTPNIYKLKRQGLSFEDVITHSSRTWIAFVSMLASVYFDREPEKTLPGVLNEYGYVTVAITQQPQLYKPKLLKVRQDFKYINSLSPSAVNILRKLGISGIAYKLRSERYFRIYKFGQRVYKTLLKMKNFLHEGVPEKSSMTWMDAKNLNSCIHDLVKIGKIKEPFFIWLHYLDPHYPYSPPTKYLDGKIDKREAGRLNGLIEGNYPKIKKEDRKGIKELYKGEVRYVDMRVSELLTFLKKQGLMKNTVTIISADHGEEFFEHGGVQHSIQLYEEVVRVPFIIHGIRKRGGIRGQRGHINLAPTILDIISLPQEKAFEGRSMFRGADKEIVMKTAYGKLGIRSEKWKYISLDELYDLKRDPKERKNVADKYPDIVKGFEKKLEGYKVKDDKVEKVRQKLSKSDEELIKERLKSLGYID